MKYEFDNRVVKIKYFTDKIDKLTKIDNGDWIDLRAAETVVRRSSTRLIDCRSGLC